MNNPKFIITSDGHLRIGYVDQHRELLMPGDQCIGGGWWEIDSVGMRLVLSRCSYDFGEPKWKYLLWDDIPLKVPSLYKGMAIVYVPDDRSEDDFMVSKELKIVYY